MINPGSESAITQALFYRVVKNESIHDVVRRRILAGFEQRCRADIRQLQEAYEREDLCTLMEAAYSIGGASKVAGEARLSSACDAIERAGAAQFAAIDDGTWTSGSLSVQVRCAYRRVQRELASLRHRLYLEM